MLSPSPLPFASTRETFGAGAAPGQALIDAQREATARAAPQLIIVLVPLFTVFLKFIFDRRRYYSEHLVHAFHLHAFVFLVLSRQPGTADPKSAERRAVAVIPLTNAPLTHRRTSARRATKSTISKFSSRAHTTTSVNRPSENHSKCATFCTYR